MSDIVERLDKLRRWLLDNDLDVKMPEGMIDPEEAAAEITALRAELATQIQWVKDLADSLIAEEIKASALRAENVSLSAWQCVYTDGKTGLVGDEHGNQYCAMARQVEVLRAENERLRAALELFACNCTGDKLCKFPHACRNYVARAALEESKE